MRDLPATLRWAVWLLSAFLLFPVLMVVISAFTSGDFIMFPPPGWSVRWFVKVLTDPQFTRPLWNSLVLGVAATAVASALAIPAALALVRWRSAWARTIEVAFLAPLSLPTILLAVGLLFTSARVGLGDSFLALLGGHVVVVSPYVLRTVIGVYAGLDASLEEAAAVLGASPWQRMRHVTLPLVKTGILAGAVFAFLMSFDEVAVALLLTTPRTVTLPVSILSYLVYNYDPSVAAIATVQIAIAILLLLVLERMVGLRRLMLPGTR